MLLKRVIFECRFKPTFTWLDRKGSHLDFLRNTNYFDGVSNGPQNIAGLKEKRDWFHSLNLEPDKVAGTIEAPSLQESDFSPLVKIAMDLRERAAFDTSNIIRIGARFVFVKEDEYAHANSFATSLIAPQLKDVFEAQSFIDSAIVPVARFVTEAGQKHSLRMATGPLRPEEYNKFFNRPAIVGNESGYMCDADYYSVEFTSARIDKFVKTAFQKCKSIVDKIGQKLDEHESDAE